MLSALLLRGVRVPPLERQEATAVSNVIRKIRDGLSVIGATRALRSLLIVSLFNAIFATGIWNTRLLPFATDILGGTEFEFDLQEGMTSVGFVVGSFFMARYADRLRDGVWIIIGLLAMGLLARLWADKYDATGHSPGNRFGRGARTLRDCAADNNSA